MHELAVADEFKPLTNAANSRSTNSMGTTVDRESSTNVTLDERGNRVAVIKNTTTTNPDGMFNSETTSNTQVVRSR